MTTISVCMIVKNEEKVLSRCLDGIKNAVDEIIIADTGSTDSTKDIAYRYTDKVYDFEWTDNFSEARNFSFSKATKDFILWLDADDVITSENNTKLIELKNNLDNTDTVMMKYNTAFDEDSNATFSYFRERLVRRATPHKWKGRVHEAIEYTGRTIYSDIEINHHSVKTEYSTRNLDIYEKQRSDGELVQPRDIFYYARELYYHKKYNKAISILHEFLENENAWIENKIEACKILSACYRETDNIDKAIEILFISFAYDTPRAEICCAAGNLLMQIGKYKKAIYWFELALTLNINEHNGGFTDIDSYGYTPSIQLCVCYDKLKNYTKAEEYNIKAGLYRPHSAAYLQNLEYFKTLHQNGVL